MPATAAGVLAAVVRGDVPDDVGVSGLAKDEGGVIVEGVFLCGGGWLEGFSRYGGWEGRGGGTEKKVSAGAQGGQPGEKVLPIRVGGMKLLWLPLLE